jgi:hypothetical protein
MRTGIVVTAEECTAHDGRQEPVHALTADGGIVAIGAPPADTAALEDLLLRLGRLAEEHPEIAELDLNPVLAGPGGIHPVDAKLRLSPAGPEPDPVLRQLREPG